MHPILMTLPQIRSYLKKVFWPKLGVGRSVQVLKIPQYSSGLNLTSALILNQNPFFEIASMKTFKNPVLQSVSMRPLNILIAATVAAFFFSVTPGCMQRQVKPQADDTSRPVLSHSGERYYYYALSRFFKNKGQLSDAIDLMDKVGKLDPDSAFIQRELALLHLNNKDAQAALKTIEAALGSHPEDIALLNIYGRLLDEKSDLEGASRTYAKILAIDPQQQNAYLFLGSVYTRMKLERKAVGIYRKMVKRYPEAYAGHYFLGRIYQQQGKQRSAEKAFERTLAINPDLEEPKFALVSIYLSRGKADLAIEMYRGLLARNPKNIKAAAGLAYLYIDQDRAAEATPLLLGLGRRSLSDLQVARDILRLYIDPKKYKEAAAILAGIIDSGPASRDLTYFLGVAYEGLQDPDRAILEMKKLTPKDRFYQDAVVRIAFLYQDQEKTNKAIAHMQQAIAANPDKSEFYFYLGTLYEETGKLEEALTALHRGQANEPDSIKIQFRLGVVYDKLGDKEQSIAAMKRVIQLDANHASALNYLGYTYADLGKNLEEAEKLIARALKHKPDDGYITDSLGWVYYKQGRYSEALEMLIKAVGMVADDPIILEHLGDAYLKKDNRRKALESYRRALKVKEKDRDVLEKKIEALKGGPAE